MGYLIPSDYNKAIQSENLAQVIGSNTTIQTAAELTAIEEASSYLVQKYDLAQELQNTPPWDITATYKAGNRVYFNPAAFDATVVYTAGAYVTNGTNVYSSIAGSAAHAFAPSEWILICPQYQIFSAIYPQPNFNINSSYPVGFIIFYKDKLYTNLIATIPLSQEALLQFEQYQNVPYPNIFPDDPNNGLQVWGVGTTYNIPASTDILNTTYWLMGDNRSQQLLTYIIDIALYHMHKRVAPKNIPDLRVKAYDDAKSWLKMCAKGDVTTIVPVLQPPQGMRVRWGGNVKNKNSY